MNSLQNNQPIYYQINLENYQIIKQVDYINESIIDDRLINNYSDQTEQNINKILVNNFNENQQNDLTNLKFQDDNKSLVSPKILKHVNIIYQTIDDLIFEKNNGNQILQDPKQYYLTSSDQQIEQTNHIHDKTIKYNQNNKSRIYLSNHLLQIDQQNSLNENIQENNLNNYSLNQNILTQSHNILVEDEIMEEISKSLKTNQLQIVENLQQKIENKEQQLQINTIDQGIVNPVIDYDQDQNFQTCDINDDSSNGYQNNILSKSGVFKVKKQINNKNEKMKQKDYSIISRSRQRQLKDKKQQNEQEKRFYSLINLSQTISDNLQFFVFCDIYIEQKQIMSTQLEQSKKSDTNYFKQIQKIIEHSNSNLFEIVVCQSQETQMEFENCQKYLLGLQNQYAKQISDSLKCLQEKSHLAKESIQLIKQNRSACEYILKRKESSEQQYNKFKMETLPKYKYYFYMRYTYNLNNGNFQISDIGYSKDFVNIIAINSEYLKQKMSQIGIIEFFKRGQKTAFKISYFSQFLFNMQNMPNVIRFILDFITLDNIEIKFNVEQQLINLCKDFDQQNNFDCPFIDFVMLSLPILPDDIEQNLAQIRMQQNINIETLLKMDQEEIDFYYNYESQSFLKRYYSDIFHKNLNSVDLSNQKVDYTQQL